MWSGASGPASSATLNGPAGIAVDTAGNVYIADTNNYRIRKITKGTIATIAGSALTSSSGDGGPALAAGLGLPSAIAVDAAGNVYFSELQTNTYSYFSDSFKTTRIRKISGGIINTVAGGGSSLSDGVAATPAALGPCYGLAVDSAGDLFISDNGYDRIREVLSTAPTFQVSAQTLNFTGMAGAAAPSPQVVDARVFGPGFEFQRRDECAVALRYAVQWIYTGIRSSNCRPLPTFRAKLHRNGDHRGSERDALDAGCLRQLFGERGAVRNSCGEHLEPAVFLHTGIQFLEPCRSWSRTRAPARSAFGDGFHVVGRQLANSRGWLWNLDAVVAGYTHRDGDARHARGRNLFGRHLN